MSYRLITGSTAEKLEERVNYLLERGWRIAGNVFMTTAYGGVFVIQPMIYTSDKPRASDEVVRLLNCVMQALEQGQKAVKTHLPPESIAHEVGYADL